MMVPGISFGKLGLTEVVLLFMVGILIGYTIAATEISVFKVGCADNTEKLIRR